MKYRPLLGTTNKNIKNKWELFLLNKPARIRENENWWWVIQVVRYAPIFGCFRSGPSFLSSLSPLCSTLSCATVEYGASCSILLLHSAAKLCTERIGGTNKTAERKINQCKAFWFERVESRWLLTTPRWWKWVDRNCHERIIAIDWDPHIVMLYNI